MTSVDILLYIKDHYREFPNFRGRSPVEILARLPEKDERYRLEEVGLVAILREVK